MCNVVSLYLFFKILLIYLREREQAQVGGGAERGESPLNKEPNSGPDPWTPVSSPKWKADAQPAEPHRRPCCISLNDSVEHWLATWVILMLFSVLVHAGGV